MTLRDPKGAVSQYGRLS